MSCVIKLTYNMASSDVSVDCAEHGFIGYIPNYQPKLLEHAELPKRMFEDHKVEIEETSKS